MRAALVLIHRYGGLAIAPFLIVAGLTGSVLAFMPELDAWLNPRLFVVAGDAPARPLSSLVAGIEAQRPELTVAAVQLPSQAGRSVSMFVQPRAGGRVLDNDQLFVDPATGRILGERYYAAFRPDAAHLLPFLRRVHYSLHIPGMAGIWLMGGVALAWMADCFVGLVLTFPRGRPFWRKWRPIWGVKKGAGRFRLHLDLHRASGLWFWPPLLLLALSSVALNLPNEVFRPVLSRFAPTSPAVWDLPHDPPKPGPMIGFGQALTAAQRLAEARGWTQRPSALFRMNDRHQYLVVFDGDRRPGLGASSLLIDGGDGRVVHVQAAGGGKPGDTVIGLMRPIHTGDVAGLPGRILIAAAGLVVTLLSITGVYIWWKKARARLASARRRPAYTLSPKAAGHGPAGKPVP